MRDIKDFISHLSNHPGVYQMLDVDGTVLYVGKAKSLKKRIASYFSKQSRDLKTQTLVEQIHDIDITVTQSENEAVLLECNLIKKHRPRYNILLRDDKSYPYILITTDHPYPRIDLYRGKRKRKGSYFGPFASAYAVRETINLLQKLFRIRTCQDTFFQTRKRPCLLHQIDRCTGPCVGLISASDYAESINLAIKFLQGKSGEVIKTLQNKMEESAKVLNFEQAAQIRDQIVRLRNIQERQHISTTNGDADILGFAMQAGIVCIQLLSIRKGLVLGSRSYFPIVPAHSFENEILSAFITQHYFDNPEIQENIPKEIILTAKLQDQYLLENALIAQSKHKVKIIYPERGEKKQWLEMATHTAQQSLVAHLFNKTNVMERMAALQKTLGLKKLPSRIECFDISHSSGEATVASCVVFNSEGPVKSDYRRFNINNDKKADDLAAMREVISRRFKRLKKEEAELPNIVLIDGGKNQLNIAYRVISELEIDKQITLIGVSKGIDRKPGFETLHFLDRPPLHLTPDDLALLFIQQIRDEAHRFAITGHRMRRDKVRRTSTLELIPGIGTQRRRALLRHFGGIQGLSRASLYELTKVPGISRSLAERIFAILHDTTV